MGYATTQWPCGCRHTRLLEPPQDVWVVWVRCLDHADPQVDDPKRRDAARQWRQHAACLRSEGTARAD
jgi:hypothetical protein